MSELTCAGCGGPVEVQHKAGLPPCDLHPPVVAELSVEVAGPVDWPARFRAAAEVADECALHESAYHLREIAGITGFAEAIGRALLGQEES